MIYCVEDERNIRELLVYTLHSTGFEAKGDRKSTRLNSSHPSSSRMPSSA